MTRPFSFIAMLVAIACSTGVPATTSYSQTKKLPEVPFSQMEARHKPEDTVAIVNGVLVTFADFSSVLAANLNAYHAHSTDTAVSDSMYSVLVDSAWDQMLGDILIEKEIEKRKLGLSPTAVKDSLLHNPPNFLRQEFTDSTGTFRRDLLQTAMNDPRNDTAAEVLIEGARIRFETERLISSIAPKHSKPDERQKAFDAWLEKAKHNARIMDRRIRFGFY